MTEALAAGERYAGFWSRVLATLIDSLLITAITLPLLLAIYGEAYLESSRFIRGPADLLITYVLPAIAVIVLWATWQSTPGKMLLRLRIADASTGGAPTPRQCLIRYVAYLVSLLPLGLGFAWVGWDARKQGWHDKLANTVVVRRVARASAAR